MLPGEHAPEDGSTSVRISDSDEENIEYQFKSGYFMKHNSPSAPKEIFMIKYHKEIDRNSSTDTIESISCRICFSTLSEIDLFICPNNVCGKKFHYQCIVGNWEYRRDNCPYCTIYLNLNLNPKDDVSQNENGTVDISIQSNTHNIQLMNRVKKYIRIKHILLCMLPVSLLLSGAIIVSLLVELNIIPSIF